MALHITCPLCGKRDGYEFRYGGEDKGPKPESPPLDSREWCRQVHMNQCLAGVQKEWWFHRSGCGSWFTIFRDTRTNVQVEMREDQTERGLTHEQTHEPAHSEDSAREAHQLPVWKKAV